jgi:small subunit ribosomal protein S4e
MANKGEDKTQKALSASKARKMQRKKHVWTVKDRAGPHRKTDSVPLAFVLRDLLGLAKTMKEAKTIMNQRIVSVNGKIRTEKGFAVGLFDLIEIGTGKEKKSFRASFDSKRRIKLTELNEKQNEKLGRVEKKTVLGKKAMQFSLNDGTTIVDKTKSLKAKLQDTIKFELPSKKVIEVIEFKEGNTAYLIGGKHVSETGKIEKIIPGTQKRKKFVILKSGNEEIKTIAENIFVCGKEQPDKIVSVVKTNE